MTLKPDPHIVAHRGMSGLYPESTLRAFEEALKLDGVHGIECDVRLTRDGRLVVHHDAFINRTSDGMGRIAKMDFEDIRKFNFGTKEDPQQILLLDECWTSSRTTPTSTSTSKPSTPPATGRK